MDCASDLLDLLSELGLAGQDTLVALSNCGTLPSLETQGGVRSDESRARGVREDLSEVPLNAADRPAHVPRSQHLVPAEDEKPGVARSSGKILAFRRHVGALDGRLPPGVRSLRRAAWAGLQDSMPRAALLSIHARVEGTHPSSWEDPSLVQLWGPRFSTYVVPARDRALFSLARLPDDARGRRTAEGLAVRLHAFLAGRRMTDGEAGRGLGEHPNRLRYAAATRRVLIRWDGARAPTIWTVPPPEVDPLDARRALARRYLHVFGPTTPAAFARWSGIAPAQAQGASTRSADR